MSSDTTGCDDGPLPATPEPVAETSWTPRRIVCAARPRPKCLNFRWSVRAYTSGPGSPSPRSRFVDVDANTTVFPDVDRLGWELSPLPGRPLSEADASIVRPRNGRSGPSPPRNLT